MNNEGTKKENIGWTYQECEEYHPIFGYLGAEGYLLSCELRPVNQYCQKGIPEFLRRMLEGLGEYPSLDVTYEVIERRIDRDEQALIIPEIEVNTLWSNTAARGGTTASQTKGREMKKRLGPKLDPSEFFSFVFPYPEF
jgi:hypothetical protein